MEGGILILGGQKEIKDPLMGGGWTKLGNRSWAWEVGDDKNQLVVYKNNINLPYMR